MAHINLLPWREDNARNKPAVCNCYRAFSSINRGDFVYGARHFSNQIDHQKYRNKILQTEITTLDAS